MTVGPAVVLVVVPVNFRNGVGRQKRMWMTVGPAKKEKNDKTKPLTASRLF